MFTITFRPAPGSCFPEGKSAGVCNCAWSYTFTSPIRLYYVILKYRDNCTLMTNVYGEFQCLRMFYVMQLRSALYTLTWIHQSLFRTTAGVRTGDLLGETRSCRDSHESQRTRPFIILLLMNFHAIGIFITRFPSALYLLFLSYFSLIFVHLTYNLVFQFLHLLLVG
jgi:hypothetical protein